jgi:hypothetical protein
MFIMQSIEKRRGFLGRALALVGGLAVVPAFAQRAEAGRSRFRRGWGGWGGYGYGYGRRRSHYRRGWGGYGGFGRSYYGGYGGYGRSFYGGYGGYGVPYVRPFGGPFYGPAPRIYGGPGFFPPMMKRQASPFSNPLSLLEA